LLTQKTFPKKARSDRIVRQRGGAATKRNSRRDAGERHCSCRIQAALPAAERRQILATGASPWALFWLSISPRHGRKIPAANLTPLPGLGANQTDTHGLAPVAKI
jgi:hypothetical protein